jgi:hypothetical protein
MKYNFDKTIYKIDAIRISVDHFSHIVEFEIVDKKNSWELSMADCKIDDKEQAFDEFANYVLAVSQNS